jgi:hypothetical protein
MKLETAAAQQLSFYVASLQTASAALNVDTFSSLDAGGSARDRPRRINFCRFAPNRFESVPRQSFSCS